VSGTYTRASQVVAEALVAANGDYVRASQIAMEALIGPLGYVRASQVVIEALAATNPDGHVRTSQVVQEVLVNTLGYVRASQIVAEALVNTLGYVRVSQCVIEILLGITYEVPMPATYPTLIGLTFPVVKTPIFSTLIGTAASGKSVRFACYENPIWEFTLAYDYLPDKWVTNPNTSDLKTLMGFYLQQGGALLPFQFLDPDDNTVTGQFLGTTDGVTNTYDLVRTFGGTDGTLTEPIGMLNTSQTFNVYLGGALQSTEAYVINDTLPLNNSIGFNTTPAAGLAVTVDMSYYYWVRFKDDQYDFNKFMSNLWETKKVVLHSLRS
jgi:hypothetical protein